MWLTTPRMLVIVGMLAAVLALVASAVSQGALSEAHARIAFGAVALVLMALVVVRARARWRSWRDRQ